MSEKVVNPAANPVNKGLLANAYSAEILDFAKLATGICEQLNCHVYDIDLGTFSGARTLRVFIDNNKQGGVGMEDCIAVTRALNEVLDVQEDLVPGGAYNLEVSSPGVERPLRQPWHFQAVVGQKIWVKLTQSLKDLGAQTLKMAGHKQLTSEVVAADDQVLTFAVEDDDSVRIPYSAIEKSHVVFEFGGMKKDLKNANKNPSKKGKK